MRGKVFEAWTSGDLEKMLLACKLKAEPIDRHFLLLGIVEKLYKLSHASPEKTKLCMAYSALHIKEFPSFIPALLEDGFEDLPSVPTFKKYGSLLESAGRYDDAMRVYKLALNYGIPDNTKHGFKGRIEHAEHMKSTQSLK